jgi:hypothetical protein
MPLQQNGDSAEAAHVPPVADGPAAGKKQF